VHTDTDAREARVFGARVSGQTLLYATDARLLFAGGIICERGHPGDNDGAAAIAAAALRRPTLTRTPVFGCLLRGPAIDPASFRVSQD
jgi:hypothetical protein